MECVCARGTCEDAFEGPADGGDARRLAGAGAGAAAVRASARSVSGKARGRRPKASCQAPRRNLPTPLPVSIARVRERLKTKPSIVAPLPKADFTVRIEQRRPLQEMFYVPPWATSPLAQSRPCPPRGASYLPSPNCGSPAGFGCRSREPDRVGEGSVQCTRGPRRGAPDNHRGTARPSRMAAPASRSAPTRPAEPGNRLRAPDLRSSARTLSSDFPGACSRKPVADSVCSRRRR